MKLTEKDYKDIASMITEGQNNIKYEKGGETLSIDCKFQSFGSYETDFYNGTGYYVEFARQLTVNGVECRDANGRKAPCKIDEGMLEKLVA